MGGRGSGRGSGTRGRVKRLRGGHLELLSTRSSSAVATTHSFSPASFMSTAESASRPSNAIVVRPSNDLRRLYHETVPFTPPSPVKRARIEASTLQPNTSTSTVQQQDSVNNESERYQMYSDDYDNPLPPPPRPKAPPPRKPIFSDPTLYTWKANSRERFLLELIRQEACGDASTSLCPECRNPAVRAAYRCRECKGGSLLCRDCCVQRHLWNPLHVVEAWDGNRFLPTSLKALGLKVQFGHPPGQACSNPEPGRAGFIVLHHNGIHEVCVRFCGPGCANRVKAGPLDTQLLRGGWYPASEDRPQTCVTLAALKQFHVFSLQSKMSMYDYYHSLEKITRHDGVELPDRYQVFIRVCKEYRHLTMLKRAGRAHHEGGARSTQPGELAVLCPACPRPGVNLPDDWEHASKEDSFIYILYLALDACFRMKRGLISSELKDPGLGNGMAFMVETVPYREYLLTVTDQDEMSTCSGLAALDYANTKFSRGYSTTGVGMGVCARHEFIQPNGIGALQKGERYSNMDYVFGSILRYHDPRLRKMVSYDIVCQWWKNLMERMLELPPLVRSVIVLSLITFVIPKMHIHAHTPICGITFSLNLTPGSGETDGEGIERPWSNFGRLAGSTKLMGPGAFDDTVDDHASFWNWRKVVSLAGTLRRRLDKALEQQVVQKDALDSFSQLQQDRVESWKKMVHDFEDKLTTKNPYEVVFDGLTESEVRLQFQKEEEEQARRGLPAKHKVTPSSFMAECLDVEEEQREVRVQVELKKTNTTSQQIDISALRTKLIRRLERLRKLQATYSPASLLALEKRDAPADEQPEDEPLYLPSSLPAADRAGGGCTEGLFEMEDLMRDAQCHSSLMKLRNQLVIKARFLNYKQLHARHQGATTRARSIVNRNELKIRLHSEKYQTAWAAILAGAGGDVSKVGWRKLRKEDIRCMEDPEDMKKKEERRKRAKARRAKKAAELLSHAVDIPSWAEEASDDESDGADDGDGEARQGGENRRELSWIWMAASCAGTDAELEDALRIEWSKTYARSRRWNEEVRILQEEFRRLPIALEFEASMWRWRLEEGTAADPELDAAYTAGLKAYALEHEAMFLDLAARARETEKAPKLARGKMRRRIAMVDPFVDGVPVAVEEDRDGDGGDDDDDSNVANNEAETEAIPGVEDDEQLLLGGEVDDI
ncbi:CxC2 domain-containing protein [Favolaschia claudopus]|uniref:CxC2 domain-containing protein n=1 Tax=Favolaschia claudopus TaxID=2862362 RepID=A0AAW0B266_9AGAR